MHYGTSMSEVADYTAAASHSSRATQEEAVSGALFCDYVASVLGKSGNQESGVGASVASHSVSMSASLDVIVASLDVIVHVASLDV